MSIRPPRLVVGSLCLTQDTAKRPFERLKDLLLCLSLLIVLFVLPDHVCIWSNTITLICLLKIRNGISEPRIFPIKFTNTVNFWWIFWGLPIFKLDIMVM